MKDPSAPAEGAYGTGTAEAAGVDENVPNIPGNVISPLESGLGGNIELPSEYAIDEVYS